MSEANHDTMHVEGGRHIKMWTRGVPVEEAAREQLRNIAKMPFIFQHVAVMPDVHLGKGSTVGSVIPTLDAIIPAAVGVDIGCGMIAAKTTLAATDLPDNLSKMRSAIERAVPHGRSPGKRDKGSWGDAPPENSTAAWATLAEGFARITAKYPHLERTNHRVHLGTLGTGNHFVEVCLDEANAVWFMLHSGSRGIGNAIGSHFIELAREDMRQWMINLPDRDLAYFPAEQLDEPVLSDSARRIAAAYAGLIAQGQQSLDARAALARAYPALPLWLLPQREPPPTSLSDLHELVTQFVRAA